MRWNWALPAGALLLASSGAAADAEAPLQLSIPQIQGPGHFSPFAGQRVMTEGVVTVVASNGFYLQDPGGDGDPDTSDALFVETGARPALAPGDVLRVRARVEEFTPGGAASGNLPITQLVDASLETRGSASVPAPVRLGAGGRRLPDRVIDDDGFERFDPGSDGIDFYESLEGMRVTARRARAVSGTNAFGEIFAVVDGGSGASGLSSRGTLKISADDFNPERVQLQLDARILRVPLGPVNAGARLGDVTGVVSYAFGAYEVRVSEPFVPERASSLFPEITRIAKTAGRLSVASFNVLNLDPNDEDGDADVGSGRFIALARIIASNLRGPDIVALQEIQDGDGRRSSSLISAELTLQRLVDSISAVGGPAYTFVDHPFIGAGTSGGEPGGDIRVAYLYNPARVELVSGSLRTVTDPADQQRNRANPFFGSRLPLVAAFRFRGAEVTLVNCHLSSKGGSAPLFGSVQPAALLQDDPAVNGGVAMRRAQAEAIASFVGQGLDADPDSSWIVLGDFNEFEFGSPLALLGARLGNLVLGLRENERYSFSFEGNSQALDQLLVSPNLRRRADFDIVHVNSEFAETPARASDHDPLLASFELPGHPPAAP